MCFLFTEQEMSKTFILSELMCINTPNLNVIGRAVLEIQKWGAHVRTCICTPTCNLTESCKYQLSPIPIHIAHTGFERSRPSRCRIRANGLVVTPLTIARATCCHHDHIGHNRYRSLQKGWGHPALKTACRFDVPFQRYQLLKKCHHGTSVQNFRPPMSVWSKQRTVHI